MTTKQNTMALANTARDCANRVGSKTLAAMVAHWNLCVEQAGFKGEYEIIGVPGRKAHLAATLNRMADDMEMKIVDLDLAAGNPVDEEGNDTREWCGNDIEEAHALARMQNDFESLDLFAQWNAQDAAHSEALEMNAETDRRRHCSVMASLQNTIMERDDITELVEACQAEALIEDKRFNWLANRWGLFHASIKWVQVEMLNAAHTEALEMNISEDQAMPYLAQQEFTSMSAEDKAMAVSRDHTEALIENDEFDGIINLQQGGTVTFNQQPYRADGGEIGTDRIKEIAHNPYGDEEKCWLAKRVLALLDELEVATDACNGWQRKFAEADERLQAAEKRIADQCGIIASARRFISEYAGLGDVGAAEFIKIIDRAAAGKGE